MDKQQLIELLQTVEDPELHIDIYTLGLIYEMDIKETQVYIKMTFTSPFCPFGPQMVDEIKDKIKEQGFTTNVEITFDPPWEPSEDLRAMLGV
jgi:metal-sulfur cluster biosynthetic enzyme